MTAPGGLAAATEARFLPRTTRAPRGGVAGPRRLCDPQIATGGCINAGAGRADTLPGSAAASADVLDSGAGTWVGGEVAAVSANGTGRSTASRSAELRRAVRSGLVGTVAAMVEPFVRGGCGGVDPDPMTRCAGHEAHRDSTLRGGAGTVHLCPICAAHSDPVTPLAGKSFPSGQVL